MSDGKVIIDTSLDNTGIENGLSKLQGICKKGAGIALKAIGGVSAAIAAVGGFSIKVGAEFEASMSKVAAVSGATEAELQKLTDKAKEMGATTKFSASESAEALNYMAMAGWKTEDMLDGLEGIMNLAAASGSDLATTSDIVTDALTAFGLKAEDAGHFADILAAASSNANTNVEMMGETFKYVAPVAGALGFSAEDCAVAIGLMANSGIKSTQAGTSLRAILNRLSSPTKEVASAMERLGVSMTDEQGNMRELNDIMVDLRKGFSGLSEAEKAELASSIAGQEAMSGLLAIVGATEEDFNKLTGAINECDGVAAQMAETMNDNLAGKFTILKSAAEGFGIAVYERMEKPLKELCEKGIKWLGELTTALEERGLQGAAEAAGKIVAELLTYIAQKAPDVINAAVTVIQNFVKGIKEHSRELIAAAGAIVEALARGIADLLPEAIRKPLNKMIDQIRDSLTNGGLKKGLQDLAKLFKTVVEVIGKIISVVGPALVKILDFIAGNLKVIGPILAGVIAGFIAYRVVMVTLTTVIPAVRAAWSALQKVMSADPIYLVIAACAALATALAVIPTAYEEAYDEAYKFSDAQQAVIDKAEECDDALERQRKMMMETWIDVTETYGGAAKAADELSTIVDANGVIMAGQEEHAAGIVEQLNNILGLGLEVQDGVIVNYEKIIASLDEIIAKKQIEAMIDAAEADVISAKAELPGLYEDLNAALSAVAESDQELLEAEQTLQELYDEPFNPSSWDEHNRKVQEAQAHVDGLKQKNTDLHKALDITQGKIDANQATISNYDSAVAAAASGGVEEMNIATAKMAIGFQTAEHASRESLVNQAQTIRGQLDSMKGLVAEGYTGISEEMIAQYEMLAADAEAELEKYDAKATEGMQQTMDDTEDVIEKSDAPERAKRKAKDTGEALATTKKFKSIVLSAAVDLCNGVKQGLEQSNITAHALQAGQNFGDGLQQGIRSRISAAAQAAADLVRTAIASANAAQDAHSPAKELIKAGHNFGDGAIIGIKDREQEMARTAGEFIEAAIESVSGASLFARFRGAIDGATTRVAGAMMMNAGAGVAASTSETVVNQTININQPVKSPVETSRELRKVARELAFVR